MNFKNKLEQSTNGISRRMFLQLGLWITGIASTWVIFKFLGYAPPQDEFESSVILDPPFTYPLGTANYIPQVRAWLIRDEEGLYAISSTCTHLGCLVNEEEGNFVCPCHGSQFDLSGKVLNGPAAAPLENYEVSLSSDGNVIIDRRVIVPQTFRLKLNG